MAEGQDRPILQEFMAEVQDFRRCPAVVEGSRAPVPFDHHVTVGRCDLEMGSKPDPFDLAAEQEP